MLPKFAVEFTTRLKGQTPVLHYGTDDPVACEEFLVELLEHGFKIATIRHEGLDLPKEQFDKMVKTAGGMLASRSICQSLGISTEEERYRFGFAA
jgi:hypothetical protein